DPSYGSNFFLTDAATPNDSGWLLPGAYSVTETVPLGWTLTSATCSDGSLVSAIDLGPGETVTCTFTNTKQPAYLTLVKTVVNDNGGTLNAANFPVRIDGNPVTWGVANALSAGTHTASEITQPGYSASIWGGDCNADGTITLLPGDNKTCTITNNDIAPTLKLVKTVINDNGGTLTPANFPVRIDGASVAWGVAYALSAGPHTASETTQTGYAASAWSGDCAANGTITLALGQTKTCTITNNDIPTTPTLSADAHAFCSAWWVDFYSNVTAQYYIRVKLDGHTEFEESGAFIGNKSLHGDWHLGGTDIRIMRMTYWVKVGDQQVGDDETWTRDCGTPPPPPPPPPPPTPTPTPFIEILEVERLPVTGAVSPSGPFGAPWLSAIGLLLIASGGILHWLKKRE
ncbi:MAG: LPXTG cell wall anchor domain-containing protein, partial [Anaerolineae bacterium]|nr:LPXTG cell wall anchor domain-containing protein [Anaerolineae bacterium]